MSLISPHNSVIYGILFMSLIIIGIYFLIRCCEIKVQQKYLPIENVDMSHEQYIYALHRLSKLISLYQNQLYCATDNYYKESNKRFEWTICKKRLSVEESQISEAENKLKQLCILEEKLYSQNITIEDISLLNKLLDKRNYRLSIAWFRL